MAALDFSIGLMAGEARNVYEAESTLYERIRQVLSSLIDQLPPKAEVLKAAGEAYDRYVAPIDIPGVPNVIEPWFDQMAKQLFLRAVAGLYDSLIQVS